jgi:hypothetical protein
VIKYIHLNPVKHRVVKDLSTWRFSSYNVICSDSETFVARENVLRWFGGLNEFKWQHEHEDNFRKFKTFGEVDARSYFAFFAFASPISCKSTFCFEMYR